jgi:hypothetical protein
MPVRTLVKGLVENEQKKKLLDNLLLMYNLIGIVDFLRHNSFSSSAIDNIFIYTSRFHDYSLIPFSNDLSDHDAQILIIKTLYQSHSDISKIVWKVDQHTISDFILNLSNEFWDSNFSNKDANLRFNSFLNTYLRIFYSSFLFIHSVFCLTTGPKRFLHIVRSRASSFK